VAIEMRVEDSSAPFVSTMRRRRAHTTDSYREGHQVGRKSTLRPQNRADRVMSGSAAVSDAVAAWRRRFNVHSIRPNGFLFRLSFASGKVFTTSMTDSILYQSVRPRKASIIEVRRDGGGLGEFSILQDGAPDVAPGRPCSLSSLMHIRHKGFPAAARMRRFQGLHQGKGIIQRHML
jgi:hypothetical protein